MKVLWLAAYPYEFVIEKTKSKPHPIPWVTEMAKYIARDYDLTISNFSWRTKYNIITEKDGINFVFIKIPNPIINLLTFNLIKINRLRCWLKKNASDYDLIHINGIEYQFGFSARSLNIPTIVSIQGLVHKCIVHKKKLDIGYFIWLSVIPYELYEIRHYKNFICRTNWDTSIIRNNNPNAKIYKNWELIRSEFYLTGQSGNFESNNIVFLGGVNQMKGIEDALAIIDQLNKHGEVFILVIIGYGSINQVNKLIRKNNLEIYESQIKLLGFKNAEEIVMTFKDSFCLIHPTLIDNSPNTISEAQIFGLPVLAHNVGGVSSLIEHEKTGILIEPHNIQMFVSNIIRLKNDICLYNNIICLAKEVASVRHNPASIVYRIKQIYSELIENS